jgi:sugar diacid utilization regulator
MFELDHDLAQDIVDRAMAILPYNVNVMDSQGLILGSGEPERINTRHEGAQLVLANGAWWKSMRRRRCTSKVCNRASICRCCSINA